MRTKFICSAIFYTLFVHKIKAQDEPKLFNQQFSFSAYYRDGIFSKLSAYNPGNAEYVRLLGLNLSYSESFFKRYTFMSNLITGIGEYGAYNKYNGWHYVNGKYWGANQPTVNKPLPYVNIDAVWLLHRQDTLIDKQNDNIHITRIIHGIRLGILYRHHPVNDALNADAGTGSDSIPLNGEMPATGSVADDGTLWGGAYYSSTDHSGRTMTNSHFMPPSVSNIFIPALSLGYGFLKYIDGYIHADDAATLKIANCPPGKASGHRTFINYYADVLVGYPYVQAYKDAEGGKHSFTPGKSKGYTREYIGFRIGMEYNYGSKRNVTTKVELARYPDLLTYYNYDNDRYSGFGEDYNNLFYINIRIGIGLFRESKHTINKIGQGESIKKSNS